MSLSWSLYGEFKPEEDFVFDDNVAIIDGKLKISCALGAVMGKVRHKTLAVIRIIHFMAFGIACV